MLDPSNARPTARDLDIWSDFMASICLHMLDRRSTHLPWQEEKVALASLETQHSCMNGSHFRLGQEHAMVRDHDRFGKTI